MTIDADKRYVATVNTNQGSVVIELFPKEAPKTVNNFVFLAREGYYDGVIFHRVIESFMIQGGDPTGTGGGGPGYSFEDEFVPSLVFDRSGILAMANSGPNTNGSQFFITTVPTPHLNQRHTIFGTVLEGQDVAEAISKVPSRQDRPLSDVVIQSIEIEETTPGS
jgi:peptidyl-prolyl cis-trans isomerase B (cyclophilin B)